MVFWKIKYEYEKRIMDKAMPIALSHQVKEGPAKILTVIDQDKVEAFDIEVVSTVQQNSQPQRVW